MDESDRSRKKTPTSQLTTNIQAEDNGQDSQLDFVASQIQSQLQLPAVPLNEEQKIMFDPDRPPVCQRDIEKALKKYRAKK